MQSNCWKAESQRWMESDWLNEPVKKKIAQMTNAELENCFGRNLEFGTGGLRGMMDVGSNKMNLYTVTKATQGLAEYLLDLHTKPACAIAYDSRHQSKDFAKAAAATLAKNGIKAFLFCDIMPTPILSFAVRHHQCQAGIVITASHNPSCYNGYKVYGEDGCQITLETAKKIQQKIDDVPFGKNMGEERFWRDAHISTIPQQTIEAYYSHVIKAMITPLDQLVRVAYSPLYGAGLTPITEILSRIGEVELFVEEEQAKPNGDFPTCPSPNPEQEAAMRLVSDLAIARDADICIATDPDCDRVGVGVQINGMVQLLSGNEIGILLLYYVVSQRTEKKTMPQNPVVVKTIVTTEMARAISKDYGIELVDVLTGFKFIGEKIGQLEQDGEVERFVFGFEESYGYLSNTFVRDKDAVNGVVLICEMVSFYKKQGLTLIDVLKSLQQKYGFYKNHLMSFEFTGTSGMRKMNEILENIRFNTPKQFGHQEIVNKIDYMYDDTGLPKSNVISLCLMDQSQMVIRPSGTEPKLKIYLATCAASEQESQRRLLELIEIWGNALLQIGQ